MRLIKGAAPLFFTTSGWAQNIELIDSAPVILHGLPLEKSVKLFIKWRHRNGQSGHLKNTDIRGN